MVAFSAGGRDLFYLFLLQAAAAATVAAKSSCSRRARRHPMLSVLHRKNRQIPKRREVGLLLFLVCACLLFRAKTPKRQKTVNLAGVPVRGATERCLDRDGHYVVPLKNFYVQMATTNGFIADQIGTGPHTGHLLHWRCPLCGPIIATNPSGSRHSTNKKEWRFSL